MAAEKESYWAMFTACGTPDAVDNLVPEEEDYRSASKKFWQTVRRLRRGKQCSANTVYSAVGGELLTSTGILSGRWKEYFEDLLNPTEVPLRKRRLGTLGPSPKPKSDSVGFRRNNAVFVPVVEHWTSSISSTGCLRVSWEFAQPVQPVHMCFVDLEKAFDRTVPCGILWGVLHEYGVRGPFAKGCSVSVRPEKELGSHCWQISRLGVARGPEGVQFGNQRISSLLFADDVVLLASSNQDLQHVLERFAAECEVAGMGISTSKSEAMVLVKPCVVKKELS
ncbi:hypothetical protein L3Q82_015673 [Scortum barcoo]|uniref:Uncharacterized protein n=1 Tax=Scortum barcoo TaxID=214431 RepID=A0ACB8VP68_9TELE|nr:hypothetical protein L3Q82_015673 [Scortum barcoo]